MTFADVAEAMQVVEADSSCASINAWDDEGAQEVYHQLAEELKLEALCAMCN